MDLKFEPVTKKQGYGYGKLPLPADTVRASIRLRNISGSGKADGHLRLAWGLTVQKMLDQLSASGRQIPACYVNVQFALDKEHSTGYILLTNNAEGRGRGTRRVDRISSTTSRSLTLTVMPEWVKAEVIEPTDLSWQWSDEHRGVVLTLPPRFIKATA